MVRGHTQIIRHQIFCVQICNDLCKKLDLGEIIQLDWIIADDVGPHTDNPSPDLARTDL